MNNIKLIISDLDGTVLNKDYIENFIVTKEMEKLAKIIDFMRSEGYPPIVFCSGRSVKYGERVIKILNAYFDIPSIFENGCCFYFSKTKKVMLHPKVKETKKVMSEILNLIKSKGYKIEKDKKYCISINPLKETIQELYQELYKELKNYLKVIEITYSQSAVDITPKGINKGEGLEFLLKITGIKKENILGIGDSKGDLPILKEVGYKAGPSNSTNDIRPFLDYVSPFPDTLGVIDILFHYFPNLRNINFFSNDY